MRVTVSDERALPPSSRGARTDATVEARLVALDTATVTVRLAGGWEYTFPADRVRRLEARGGAGLCRGGAARRLACAGTGVATGWLVGWAAGSAISREARRFATPRNFEDDPERAARRDQQERGPIRRWQAAGAAIGLAVGGTAGRHRWVAVPGWPAVRP